MGRIDPEKMRRALRFYFVMGSVNCQLRPESVLKEAIAGGVTLFQFREKGDAAKTGRDKLELGAALRDICRASGIPFIVNDNVDLALELDADGVHIGQEDEDARVVRRRIGNRILGVSTHDVTEVRHAIACGADYVGVGPMYPTATKTDTRSVRGPRMVEAIRAEHADVPLVAIGGIKADHVGPVMSAGADGVAVISAVSCSLDPRAAATGLLRAMESATS